MQSSTYDVDVTCNQETRAVSSTKQGLIIASIVSAATSVDASDSTDLLSNFDKGISFSRKRSLASHKQADCGNESKRIKESSENSALHQRYLESIYKKEQTLVGNKKISSHGNFSTVVTHSLRNVDMAFTSSGGVPVPPVITPQTCMQERGSWLDPSVHGSKGDLSCEHFFTSNVTGAATFLSRSNPGRSPNGSLIGTLRDCDSALAQHAAAIGRFDVATDGAPFDYDDLREFLHDASSAELARSTASNLATNSQPFEVVGTANVEQNAAHSKLASVNNHASVKPYVAASLPLAFYPQNGASAHNSNHTPPLTNPVQPAQALCQTHAKAAGASHLSADTRRDRVKASTHSKGKRSSRGVIYVRSLTSQELFQDEPRNAPAPQESRTSTAPSQFASSSIKQESACLPASLPNWQNCPAGLWPHAVSVGVTVSSLPPIRVVTAAVTSAPLCKVNYISGSEAVFPNVSSSNLPQQSSREQLPVRQTVLRNYAGWPFDHVQNAAPLTIDAAGVGYVNESFMGNSHNNTASTYEPSAAVIQRPEMLLQCASLPSTNTSNRANSALAAGIHRSAEQMTQRHFAPYVAQPGSTSYLQMGQSMARASYLAAPGFALHNSVREMGSYESPFSMMKRAEPANVYVSALSQELFLPPQSCYGNVTSAHNFQQSLAPHHLASGYRAPQIAVTVANVAAQKQQLANSFFAAPSVCVNDGRSFVFESAAHGQLPQYGHDVRANAVPHQYANSGQQNGPHGSRVASNGNLARPYRQECGYAYFGQQAAGNHSAAASESLQQVPFVSDAALFPANEAPRERAAASFSGSNGGNVFYGNFTTASSDCSSAFDFFDSGNAFL